MPPRYSLVNTRVGWVAEFRLDADECESVATMIPSTDGFQRELLEAAAKMREYVEGDAR